jgi:basic amino acid/polyamine antiporter, APA family
MTSRQHMLGGGSGVFRRKPVEQIATEHEGELTRTLGLL